MNKDKHIVLTNINDLRSIDTRNYRFIKKGNVLYGLHKSLEYEIDIELVVPNSGFISYNEDKTDVGNINKPGYEILKHLKILSAFLEKIRANPDCIRDYKAIHINSSCEIVLLQPKEVLDKNDIILIEDSEDDYNKKKTTIESLFQYIKKSCFLIPYVGVTITYNEGGNVFPSGLVPVKCGNDLTISINPNPGYRIKNVIVNYKYQGPISELTLKNIQNDQTVEVIFEKILLSIEAYSNNYGTIYPYGKIQVEYGQDLELMLQPIKGYKIDTITIDGVTTKYNSNIYTFTNIRQDHRLYATFTKRIYIVVTMVEGRGLISPYGTNELEYGDDLLIEIKPDIGYEIDKVEVNGENVGKIELYKIINIDRNYTIKAYFKPIKFIITSNVNDDSLGICIPSGTITCSYGSYQTFSFIANDGCHVYDVIIDGISQGNVDSYTFSNITSDHEVFVKFKKNTYSITASSSSGGRIIPSGIITAEYGSSETFTILPDSKYDIQDVIVDNKSLGPITSYTFSNIKDNHYIIAIFQYRISGYYSITAISNEGGFINPSGRVNVKSGNDIEFTITPQEGYHISTIFVDGSNVGPHLKYKFKSVNQNHTIQAIFSENPSNTICITSDDDSNVKIHPKGSMVIPKYSSLVFTITPQEGYEIKDVVVDNTSMGPISHYSFEMVDKNHTIYAIGVRKIFIINALSTSPYGLITPKGQQFVPYGDSITFVMTPNEGYKIKDVRVDGISQGEIDEYTFGFVDSDHEIEVDFEKRKYKIEIINQSTAIITPSEGTYWYEYGDDFHLILGKKVDIICDDVIYYNQEHKFSINGIDANHKLIIRDAQEDEDENENN